MIYGKEGWICAQYCVVDVQRNRVHKAHIIGQERNIKASSFANPERIDTRPNEVDTTYKICYNATERTFLSRFGKMLGPGVCGDVGVQIEAHKPLNVQSRACEIEWRPSLGNHLYSFHRSGYVVKLSKSGIQYSVHVI